MSRAVIITSYLEYPLDIPALLRPDDLIICLDGGYDILQGLDIQPDLILGDFDSVQTPLPDDGRENAAGSPGMRREDGAAEVPAEGLLQHRTAGRPGPVIRRYPPEKDYTDLELALRTLDPAETPDLLIIGGLGGRLDQTLINIQLLDRYTAWPGQEAICPGEDPSDRSGEDPSDHPGAQAEGPSYGSFRCYRRIELMDGRSSCFVVHGSEPPRRQPAKADALRRQEAAGYHTGARGTASSPEEPRCIRIPRRPDSYLSLLPLTGTCTGVHLTGAKYPLEDAVLHRGASRSISNEFAAEEVRLRLKTGSLLVVVTRGNAADQLDGYIQKRQK